MLQVCPANSAMDKSAYRQYLAGTVLAFLRSFDPQACVEVLPLLTNPNFMDVTVVSMNSDLACDRTRPPIFNADRCFSPLVLQP